MKGYKIRKNKNIFNLKSQKGQAAILLTFFIMIFIVAIILGLTSIVLKEKKMIEEMDNSMLSFYATDTGIEHSLYNILKEDGDGQVSDDLDITIGTKYNVITTNESSLATSTDSLSSNEGGFTSIYSMGKYKDKLYAGTNGACLVHVCNPADSDDPTTCDSGDWSFSKNLKIGPNACHVTDFKEYKGKFYVSSREGTENNWNSGSVHYCDSAVCGPADWTRSHTGIAFHSLEEYNGKLYAAGGDSKGIYVCDPADGATCNQGDWTLSLNPPGFPVQTQIYSLFVNENEGKLYAGTHGTAEVWICDSSGADGVCRDDDGEWKESTGGGLSGGLFGGAVGSIFSFSDYKQKTYASTYPGAIFIYDSSSGAWEESRGKSVFDLEHAGHINAIIPYKYELYAGSSNAFFYECRDKDGDGECLESDGEWQLALDFTVEKSCNEIYSLIEYKDILYIGTDSCGGTTTGNIYMYSAQPIIYSTGEYRDTKRALEVRY